MIALAPAPKDPLENAKYRRRILERAAGDYEFQQELWIRAARDLVWYVDTFGFTYSPKDYPECPTRPMILYDFQEKEIRNIAAAFGKHDLLIEKSRDMGATWMCEYAIEWRWHFHPGQSFLLGSRKEDFVDKSGDPKSLFWKLDFILQNLPGWLVPNHTRIKLHLHNEDMGSTIDGESTNDDFARGDRRTAIMLDEFPAVENGYSILSATRDATKCRLFNGTPKGAAGAYYDTRKKLESSNPDRIIRLHWSVHPEKAVGLYTSDQVGEPEEKRFVLRILDPDYRFPLDYKFVLDGKTRSPWYDEECSRAANPQEIAQELDIDYAASGWQYFHPMVLAELERKHVRPPKYRGELAFEEDGKDPGWLEQPGGRVQIWCDLINGKPSPDDEFVCGNDVATGAGGEMSSNSVCSVVNKRTGEKVAQFHTNQMTPEAFCTYAVAICRFFNNAFLIWEENGPGVGFTKAVKEIGYRNVFYREDETAFLRTKSQKAGWHSNKDTKRLLLGDYAKSLISGEFINRCAEALAECAEYVHEPNGTIVHARSVNTIDPTATGENHGDMVIADALANRARKDIPHSAEQEVVKEPPPDSFGGRRKAYETRRRTESADSW